MPEYKLSSKFNDSFSLYSKENVQNYLSKDFSTLSQVEPGGSAAKKFRSWAGSMHDLSGDFKVLNKESEENQKDDVTKSNILSNRASFLQEYIFKTLLDPIDLKEKVNFEAGINDSASRERWNQFGNGSKELSKYRDLLYEKSEEERKYIKKHCKNIKKNKKKSYLYNDDEDHQYAYKNANKLVENINKRYGDTIDTKNSNLLNIRDYITPNFIKGLAGICKNEKLDKNEDSFTEYSENISEVSKFSDSDSMENFDDISEDSLDNKSNKKVKNKKKNIKPKKKEIKYPNLYNFLYLNGNNLIKWSKEKNNVFSENGDDDLEDDDYSYYNSDSDDKSKRLKKIALGYLLDAAISDLRKYENEYTYRLQKQEKKKKGFLKKSWGEIKKPFSELKRSVIGEKKNNDLIFDEEYENDKSDDNSSLSKNYNNSTNLNSESESLEDDIKNKKSEKSNKNLGLNQMDEIAFLSTLIANAHKQLNGIRIESESENEEEEDKDENEEKNVINIDNYDYDPYRYIEKLSSEKKVAESEKLKRYYDNRAELLAYYDSLSNMDLDVMINEKIDNDNNINYDKKILIEEVKKNNELNGEKTKKTKLEEDFKSLESQIRMSGIGKEKIDELRKKIVEKDNEYNQCNKNIEKFEKNLQKISEYKAKIKNEYKSKNYESELKNISTHVHIILDKIYATLRNPELEIREKVNSAKKYTESMKYDPTWTKDNTYEYIASEVLSCNLDSYSTHYSNIISQIKENKIKTKFWDKDIDFKKISFKYNDKDNTINNPNSLEPKRDNEHVAISDFDKIKSRFPKSVKDLNTDILLNRFYHPYSNLCNTILDNHSFGENGLNEIIESENKIFDNCVKNKINLTEMEIHTLNQLIDLDKNNSNNKKRKEEIKNKKNKIEKLLKGEYGELSESEREEMSIMTQNSNEILKNYVTSNFDIQISKLDKTNKDFEKISTEVECLLKEFSEFKSFYDEDQKKKMNNFTKDYDSKKKLYDEKIKSVSNKKNEVKEDLERTKEQYNKDIDDAESNAKNNGGRYKKGLGEHVMGIISFKSFKATADLKTKIIDKSKEYDKIISDKIKNYKEYTRKIIKELSEQKNNLSEIIQKYKKTFNVAILKKLESFKKDDDEKIKKEKEDVNRKINEEFEKNREYMKRLNSGESIQDIWKDKEGKSKKIENDDSKKACEFLMKLVNFIKNQPKQEAE